MAAMARVLAAERDGLAQLRESEARAGTLITDARIKAAAIAARTDARIARLHKAYRQKIEDEITQLRERKAVPDDTASGAPDQGRLRVAARRLAAKLTGAP
jgi:hypothetical protein